MKARPLGDRVVIQRIEAEKQTGSGIVIPDMATEKPDQGIIVSHGMGKFGDDGNLRPMSVKVGDKVLFGKYAGQNFKMDGKDYMTMREDDIIGIIEE